MTSAPHSLSPQMVKRLQAAAAETGRYGFRDALMIRMGFVHGFRAAELTGLRWADIDLENHAVTIHRLKGSKDGVHPLTPDVSRSLRKLPGEHTGYVFRSERGTPVSPNSFGKIVRRAGEVAGFEVVTHPHMLRHACGFALANLGKDTRSIQAWLGHANIQNTVLYTEMSPTRFKGFWQD